MKGSKLLQFTMYIQPRKPHRLLFINRYILKHDGTLIIQHANLDSETVGKKRSPTFGDAASSFCEVLCGVEFCRRLFHVFPICSNCSGDFNSFFSASTMVLNEGRCSGLSAQHDSMSDANSGEVF